jgi:hypothetical protein
MFRGEKYPPDYSGFIGKDLSPVGIIENLNVLTDTCVMFSGFEETDVLWPVIINPVINHTIEFGSETNAVDEVLLVDLQGRVLLTVLNPKEALSLPSTIHQGMYVIRLRKGNSIITKTLFIKD